MTNDTGSDNTERKKPVTAAAEWDDLAHLAEAATSGEWEARRDSGCSWIAASSDEDPTVIADYLTVADAEFIAAANPTTILRLIEDNRRMRHGSLCPECNAKAWGERADLRRERDELAARLATVEARADEIVKALANAGLLAMVYISPDDTTKEN